MDRAVTHFATAFDLEEVVVRTWAFCKMVLTWWWLFDEMSAMFDTLRADVNMLALDSCDSGGFERAFNSARNRFGMYSSEEDVLSQVPQLFQSGGSL